MIDVRFIAAMFASAIGCSTPPPSVTLTRVAVDGGPATPPDGSDIIGSHAMGVGIVDVIVITVDKDHAKSSLVVQSDHPETLEVVAVRAPSNEFAFLAHAAGQAKIVIVVDTVVVMTFDATVAPQI